MDAIYVGIDVSKDQLDVAVRPSGESFAVSRTGAGIDDLIERLKPLSLRLVAIEATGGFETVVAAGLAGATLPVVVVNPAQVRAFAQALGKRAKTDPIDAAVIAHFAEATKPQLRQLPDATTQLLADLVARRRQIVEMIGAESNRRRHLTHRRVLRGLERIVDELQAQLTEIEREIDDTVRGTPAWRDKEDLLKTVPGIGSTIARTLIAELPELGSLDRRKIAALAGLAPFNRDSGTLRGRRTIAGGRGPVRSALYMAVMVSIRHKLHLAKTYNRLRQAGKAPKAAITACMRKLVTILNAILRDQKPWQTA
jgi:transposase